MQNNALQAGHALARVKDALSEMRRIKLAKSRRKSMGWENEKQKLKNKKILKIWYVFICSGITKREIGQVSNPPQICILSFL